MILRESGSMLRFTMLHEREELFTNLQSSEAGHVVHSMYKFRVSKTVLSADLSDISRAGPDRGTSLSDSHPTEGR